MEIPSEKKYWLYSNEHLHYELILSCFLIRAIVTPTEDTVVTRTVFYLSVLYN